MRLRACGRIARPEGDQAGGGGMGNLRPPGPSMSARGPLPPQESRKEHGNRRRLGSSDREFGRRHAGGHGRGAPVQVSWLADKGDGVTPPPARSSGGQDLGGSKGGGATLARARMLNIAWAGLGPLKVVSQPRPTPPKRRSGHRPEQPRWGRRGQPPRPRGRQPPARRGRPTPFTTWRRQHSLPRGRFLPCPYPSGTGDRRSHALLRPVGSPKCPLNVRE